MMRSSGVAVILIGMILFSIISIPFALAACEQSITYTYTNNEVVMHRVTFAVIEMSGNGLSVSFLPSPFEVRPGETSNFTIVGRSDRELSEPYVYFQIRKNAIPIDEINVTFGLCDAIEEQPIFSDDIELSRILVVMGIIFIVIIGALLVLSMDRPRRRRPSAKKEKSRAGIKRTKIDVDSLIESYEFKPKEEPRMMMILLVLLVIFIVLVLGLIFLLIITQNPTPLSSIPVSSLP